MTATAKNTRTGGPGSKEKQEKPSVQSTEEERQMKKVEEQAHHGGRGEWPDEDVNPAPEMHVEEGEKGEPARADTHDAQKRKDKKRPRDR